MKMAQKKVLCCLVLQHHLGYALVHGMKFVALGRGLWSAGSLGVVANYVQFCWLLFVCLLLSNTAFAIIT